MLDAAEEHYLRGVAALHADNFDAAHQHLQQAILLNPTHARAFAAYAQVFFVEGKIEEAKQNLARAIELAPQADDLVISLGMFHEADRETDKAVEILRRYLKSGNESTQLGMLYSQVAAATHSEAGAVNYISRVLNNRQPRPTREQATLHFCAASLLDKLGRYDEAFERATIAHRLCGSTYDSRRAEQVMGELMQFFDRPNLRRLPYAMHESELPVFIVGMPRSGTSLLEQILSSHPSIHGAGELSWLFRCYESLVRRCPPNTLTLSAAFDHLSRADMEAVAEEYLQPLAALNPSAKRIINKQPANYLHLGLVKLLFPFSKVIYCHRAAEDTCLSCYMTDFASGHDFTHSLPALGHYYRQQELMMAHWKSVLNLSMLDVRYEEVVDDLEGQTRRILEFLELPWDEKCLRFHENKRFIATASNRQARHPIFRSSVGRSKHYDRHLGPLREALKAG
jgi:tetratricopeptide (TPR) repeat protein